MTVENAGIPVDVRTETDLVSPSRKKQAPRRMFFKMADINKYFHSLEKIGDFTLPITDQKVFEEEVIKALASLNQGELDCIDFGQAEIPVDMLKVAYTNSKLSYTELRAKLKKEITDTAVLKRTITGAVLHFWKTSIIEARMLAEGIPLRSKKGTKTTATADAASEMVSPVAEAEKI
jgi:hypothetical protein